MLLNNCICNCHQSNHNCSISLKKWHFFSLPLYILYKTQQTIPLLFLAELAKMFIFLWKTSLIVNSFFNRKTKLLLYLRLCRLNNLIHLLGSKKQKLLMSLLIGRWSLGGQHKFRPKLTLFILFQNKIFYHLKAKHPRFLKCKQKYL